MKIVCEVSSNFEYWTKIKFTGSLLFISRRGIDDHLAIMEKSCSRNLLGHVAVNQIAWHLGTFFSAG